MRLQPSYSKLLEGSYWLIKLRWLAIASIFLLSLVAKYFFAIHFNYYPLFIIGVILIFFNIIYYILSKKLKTDKPILIFTSFRRILFFQITSDLLFLTIILHFSGGIENPFVIYYIFHMIIASIWLSKLDSYLVASIANIFIGTLTYLEFNEILPHHKLVGFTEHEYYQNLKFIMGTGFIFITSSYLVNYMTAFVSHQLKMQEEAYRLANIKLNNKDKIKNEFILRLTHDIKGHLAAVQSCLDVVILSESELEKIDFGQRAHSRVKKLAQFVVDLLRLTRIRLLDKPIMEEFLLNEILLKSIEFHTEQAIAKNIILVSQIPDENLILKGNAIALEEAISNLIENAIFYTPENGKITVSLIKEVKNIIIKITDTGIGIPVDEQEHIFDELYRASNAREYSPTGTGLGLALVKQIVESHDGNVTIDSAPNVGTEVKIILPIKNTLQR